MGHRESVQRLHTALLRPTVGANLVTRCDISFLLQENHDSGVELHLAVNTTRPRADDRPRLAFDPEQSNYRKPNGQTPHGWPHEIPGVPKNRRLQSEATHRASSSR